MGKILLISFFKSNNIGDLALSNAIEMIVTKQGKSVIKYDFADVEHVLASNENVSESNFSNIIESVGSQKLLSIFKRTVRNILCFFVGEYILGNLISYIRKKDSWKIFIRDLNDVDMVIIGGGNMIMDNHFDWPSIFYCYCAFAHRFKKDIHVTFVGAEPPKFKISRLLYKSAFKYASSITVRDPISKKIVEDITKQMVNETIDPVFYLKPKILSKDKSGIVTIGVCVLSKVCFKNEDDYINYFNSLVNILEKLSIEGTYSINLFSTDSIDWAAIHEVQQLLSNKNIKVKSSLPINLEDVYELFSELDYLIGGRMHSMIIAQKYELPYMGIIWQSKVKGFAMVVDSLDRLYDIDTFNNVESITKNIINDLNSIEAIKKKMRIKNIELEKIIERQLF